MLVVFWGGYSGARAPSPQGAWGSRADSGLAAGGHSRPGTSGSGVAGGAATRASRSVVLLYLMDKFIKLVPQQINGVEITTTMQRIVLPENCATLITRR